MMSPVVLREGGSLCRVPLGEAVRLMSLPDPAARARDRHRRLGERRAIDKAGILEAYQAGAPIREIMARYGVVDTTITRYARAAGLPPRHPGWGGPPPETNAAVIAARVRGATIRDLAAQFGLGYGRTRALAHRAGIARVPTRLERALPEIRARLADGETARAIARDLGFAPRTIANLHSRLFGRQSAPVWTEEEDAPLLGSTSAPDAVDRYRQAFPDGTRTSAAIRERYRRLRKMGRL